MSRIKTVVVMLRFKMDEKDEWKHVVESAEFGPGYYHGTAQDFILEVKNSHRVAKSIMEITNVVIG